MLAVVVAANALRWWCIRREVRALAAAARVPA
jgi:hypothetical protein